MKRAAGILSAAVILLTGCAENDFASEVSSDHRETTTLAASAAPEGDVSEKCEDSATSDKVTLIWLTSTPMRYEGELNEYLDEAGYDFHISFRPVNEDTAMIYDKDGGLTHEYPDNCYRAELISAAQRGADIIDTSSLLENSYLSYAENGLLAPLDEMLTAEGHGKALYESMPECYWDDLRYKGSIYGVDSYLACLGTDIEFRLSSELCKSLGITEDELSESYPEALDDIAKICSENGLVFGVQSLCELSAWTDYEFITDCIYIDENGNAANIYESSAAYRLFGCIAEHYSSGCFVSSFDCMNMLPDKVLGWTRSSICANIRNGFISSERFGIETMVGLAPALSVCRSRHSRLTSNVSVTGIYSGSEHKELAFEAICAFMNDERFINTLTYGKDYTVSNGCALYEEYGGMPMGNAVLQLSIEGNAPADRGQRLYKALEGSEAGSYSDFCFDAQAVIDKLIDIYNITRCVTDEFVKPGKANDGDGINADEYLSGLNERLYAAGLQEVLDEVNRQLEEAK